jgi:hypothetical protein
MSVVQRKIAASRWASDQPAIGRPVCTTDILSVAFRSNPLPASDRRSAAPRSADFGLQGFRLQRRRTRCPSYEERSRPAGRLAISRRSVVPCVRRTSGPSRSCRIRCPPAIGDRPRHVRRTSVSNGSGFRGDGQDVRRTKKRVASPPARSIAAGDEALRLSLVSPRFALGFPCFLSLSLRPLLFTIARTVFTAGLPPVTRCFQ